MAANHLKYVDYTSLALFNDTVNQRIYRRLKYRGELELKPDTRENWNDLAPCTIGHMYVLTGDNGAKVTINGIDYKVGDTIYVTNDVNGLEDPEVDVTVNKISASSDVIEYVEELPTVGLEQKIYGVRSEIVPLSQETYTLGEGFEYDPDNGFIKIALDGPSVSIYGMNKIGNDYHITSYGEDKTVLKLDEKGEYYIGPDVLIAGDRIWRTDRVYSKCEYYIYDTNDNLWVNITAGENIKYVDELPIENIDWQLIYGIAVLATEPSEQLVYVKIATGANASMADADGKHLFIWLNSVDKTGSIRNVNDLLFADQPAFGYSEWKTASNGAIPGYTVFKSTEDKDEAAFIVMLDADKKIINVRSATVDSYKYYVHDNTNNVWTLLGGKSEPIIEYVDVLPTRNIDDQKIYGIVKNFATKTDTEFYFKVCDGFKITIPNEGHGGNIIYVEGHGINDAFNIEEYNWGEPGGGGKWYIGFQNAIGQTVNLLEHSDEPTDWVGGRKLNSIYNNCDFDHLRNLKEINKHAHILYWVYNKDTKMWTLLNGRSKIIYVDELPEVANALLYTTYVVRPAGPRIVQNYSVVPPAYFVYAGIRYDDEDGNVHFLFDSGDIGSEEKVASMLEQGYIVPDIDGRLVRCIDENGSAVYRVLPPQDATLPKRSRAYMFDGYGYFELTSHYISKAFIDNLDIED